MKQYQEEFTFAYKEHDIKAIVTYKYNNKRILFRARSGVLLISSPFNVSRTVILKNIASLPASFLASLFEDQDIGEDYIYLLGKKHRLVSPLLEDRQEGDITYRNKEDLYKRLYSLAKATLESRVRFYEEKMEIKVPYKVKIHDTKSRHGSNSRRTHTLSFSIELIHYPLSVIDAIVVHELAHDRHFDHSKAFYEEVYKYYPNYDAELDKLKGGHK